MGADEAAPSLFPERKRQAEGAKEAAMPLAARMRPRTLDEFVGQEHIVGPGTWLRTAIESDQLSSVILYGPAGSGKSTLAHLIAGYTKARFEPYSAVTSGVADIRRVTQQARERMKATGQKTILFVDEIHRFNKAQQDAFLPFVEDGTIILIGSTTENPFFEINAPLVSRSRIFVFEPLTAEHIGTIIDRALADSERGLGKLAIELAADAREHITNLANGDARAALNALEAAAQLACRGGSGHEQAPAEREGQRSGQECPSHRITVEIVEDAAQRRLLKYDKGGDTHYDVISAYIKSLRGGDPDAAVYWLARMLAAGEDPRFIARRLVIQAAEDVGNADPMALLIANAAAHAVEFVGLPEAQIPLAQATIYVATAPKSNASYLAISAANDDVRNRAVPLVPKHLRDANYPGSKQFGHGEGYKYPHDFPGHYVLQEYLPRGTKSKRYYEPSDQGYEKKIRARMEEWERKAEEAKGSEG